MPSGGNNFLIPPRAEEIEISIFGPGYGECIVLHLGEGDWVVIDSCLDRSTRTPVAISYLSAIGVDIATRVRRVVVTHWDDDHINGIAETYRRAAAAELVVSAAFTRNEFASVLAAWRPASFISGGSGIREMDEVYQELVSRRPEGHSHVTAIPACENKVLFRRSGDLPAIMTALSPSDEGVIAALARFDEIRSKATGRTRLPVIEDNHASVVISVEVKELNLLLGGDLQVRSDRSFGWFAILDSGFAIKHEMHKASHHGSKNGSCPDLWTNLLIPNPLTVITPFIRGSVILPTLADCRRIATITDRAYLTAPPRPRTFRDPDRDAEKAIKESAITVRHSPSIFGHVRLRRVVKASTPWEVETFHDAVSLTKYLEDARE